MWSYYIDDFTNPLIHNGEVIGFRSKRYWFKNFKVYWAYNWLIAEEMDIKGVLDGTDRTNTKRINCNYAGRYIKT